MSPSIIFMGAEVPSHRVVLEEQGVTSVGVGFRGLKRRVKAPVPELLRNFPDGMDIHLYPGIGGGDMSVEEHRALAAEYETFIDTNRDRLTSWTEYDCIDLGPDWIRQRRKEFYAQFVPEVFRPVWKPDYGSSGLTTMAEEYLSVALSKSSLDERPGLESSIRTLARRYGTEFHVISAQDLDQDNLPYASLYTLLWTSPMIHGDTVIWHNRRLVRFPKKMQDEARNLYGSVVEEAGLDPVKVSEGLPSEVTKLAIWSIRQMEEYVGAKPSLSLLPGGAGRDGAPERGGLDDDHLDNSGHPVRIGNGVPPTRRHPSEKGVLPSVGITMNSAAITGEDGSITLTEVPVMTSGGATIRHCDTCFVQAVCPAFKPSHECSFHLPVEVKTRDQLISLMQTMIEMQSSRIAFARFAEELNGGYPDLTVSKEMDRLFRLLNTMKRMENDSSFVRMTVESQGGAGILSAIFGDKAGAALRNDTSDTPVIDS